MTDILKDIIKPLEAVLQGKDPTHAMSGLSFIVASIFYQSLMPAIADRDTFNNAFNLFRKQVGEDLVMLIEANKEPK